MKLKKICHCVANKRLIKMILWAAYLIGRGYPSWLRIVDGMASLLIGFFYSIRALRGTPSNQNP